MASGSSFIPLLIDSVYPIVHLFYETVVRETVIPVIMHADDEMFMDDDPHDVARMDYSGGNRQVIR